MKRHLRRASVLLAAVVVGVVGWAVPANASSYLNCPEAYLNLSTEVSCSGIPTYGYSSYTGAYGQTGYFDLDLYFSYDGTSISSGYGNGGDISVYDTWTNGRGVVVELNAHKAGTPVDNNSANYISLGYYKDGSLEVLPTAYWANGIDFVYINYADSWSNCYYCYVGTYTLINDRY